MAELAVKLTCPACGHEMQEIMPTDCCMFFYQCTACKTVLRPKPGDCCVYCSYGDRRCPFVQDCIDCPGELPDKSAQKTMRD